MWDWYQSLSSDAKTLILAVGGPVVGAALGALLKWLFERRARRQLERDREDAREDRKAAIESREQAIRDLVLSLGELAEIEVEARCRQEELDRAHREIERIRAGIDSEKSKLEQLLTTLRENETGIWTTFPRDPPIQDFDSRMGERRPLVLTVANNKGGVGKTTVVGNLIAHFDVGRGLKVLSIDLDYQGSLSTMLRTEFADVAERKSTVNGLLERGAGIGTVYEATRRLGRRLNRSELAPAFYELALFEDRLLVEWLVQAGGDDVRYRLANVLHNTAVRDKFDIVIIDVPPRLTTGTINALCASTHVLVPTIFNPIAAEPVSNFLTASTLLMNKLNPKLDFIGVVETMAPRKGESEKARAEGRRLIQEALHQSFPKIPVLRSYVPRRAAMSEGGIAYLENREARAIFDELGREIGEKMGLK